jgi:lipopolysaccharide assembly protein A
VTLHFFFGTLWRAPVVLVVLAVFALGVVVGVLGMVPRWWKHRQVALSTVPGPSPASARTATSTDASLGQPSHGI